MPHDSRAIANEFIRLNGGPMNQMKLQKLVFNAHGWSWAIFNQPLVNEAFEAWDGGPVLRSIWNHLRNFGGNANGGCLSDNVGQPYVAALTDGERAVIRHVWEKYKGYSGLELSEMTHRPGTPWSNTYFGRGRNHALDEEDIHQHFVELGLAGRAQQTA